MGSSRMSRGDDSEETLVTANPTPKIVPTTVSSSDPNHLNLTSLQITTHKLNGKNFLQWSRSIQMVICRKGKIGYLDRSIVKPDANDPKFQSWDIQNSMVMAWLIHSMEDTIGETYLFYPIAKGIWDAVNLAYSDFMDTSQIYELRNRARNLRQGELDVTQYFNALIKLWQEMDLFQSYNWKDPEDAVLYKQMLARERIYDFLTGLNQDLDEVRGRLLGTKLIVPIDRKRVMLKNASTIISTPEDAALVVHQPKNTTLVTHQPENRSDQHQRHGKKNSVWCEHCQRPYHTKATCWKLHGKPANWSP
ncbi:uncharacterized protein LOC109846996 [Asparagus officinalis]|uniref:uncharacterized protein LOC109846996 n=1 Tax=Asparagus officinalis TaxID=4686 RepID=UPI00098E69B7|nr:uncharacterized protein LOC109846996 [Asparagus officinalis]